MKRNLFKMEVYRIALSDCFCFIQKEKKAVFNKKIKSKMFREEVKNEKKFVIVVLAISLVLKTKMIISVLNAIVL